LRQSTDPHSTSARDLSGVAPVPGAPQLRLVAQAGEATQAAEIDWEHALFRVDGMGRIEVCWGKEYSSWSSVVKRWNVGAAERYWKRQARATGAGSFLRTEDVGRALLGEVLRDVKDGMIRNWMGALNPGPGLVPLRSRHPHTV
jgi:hypothetical protein